MKYYRYLYLFDKKNFPVVTTFFYRKPTILFDFEGNMKNWFTSGLRYPSHVIGSADPDQIDGYLDRKEEFVLYTP
jgi:hypothetical protein